MTSSAALSGAYRTCSHGSAAASAPTASAARPFEPFIRQQGHAPDQAGRGSHLRIDLQSVRDERRGAGEKGHAARRHGRVHPDVPEQDEQARQPGRRQEQHGQFCATGAGCGVARQDQNRQAGIVIRAQKTFPRLRIRDDDGLAIGSQAVGESAGDARVVVVAQIGVAVAHQAVRVDEIVRLVAVERPRMVEKEEAEADREHCDPHVAPPDRRRRKEGGLEERIQFPCEERQVKESERRSGKAAVR